MLFAHTNSSQHGQGEFSSLVFHILSLAHAVLPLTMVVDCATRFLAPAIKYSTHYDVTMASAFMHAGLEIPTSKILQVVSADFTVNASLDREARKMGIFEFGVPHA